MGRTSDAKERLIQAMIDLMSTQSYGSLTIDVICDAAEVKKGSFYYFFKSKLDLALATFEQVWTQAKPALDETYSPANAPLERLSIHFDRVYQKTLESKQKCGCVCGCIFFGTGSEVYTGEPELLEKINDYLARYARYFESAIGEAVADGSIKPMPAKETARILFNLHEGMLTQARIKNDPEVLLDLKVAAARILGLDTLPAVSEATTEA